MCCYKVTTVAGSLNGPATVSSGKANMKPAKNAVSIKVLLLKGSIAPVVKQENLVNEFPVEIDGVEYQARTLRFLRMEVSLNVDSGMYEGQAFFQPGKYPEPALAADYKDLLELLGVR